MTALPALLLAMTLNTAPVESPARGATLAIGCAGCHAGPTALTEPDADALFEALIAWRKSPESGAVMARIARGFSPAELRAIADYLAAP